MQNIRQSAVAGAFYPDNPVELHNEVSGYLDQAVVDNTIPKAIIVPHAGYIYSGSVAASAYAFLRNNRESITRVVLIGPSHRLPFRGLAVSGATHFSTPLGLIPIDIEAVKALQQVECVVQLDEAHSLEHSLEVQLPFLQEMLGSFKLIPLVAGDVSPEQVADVLERIWGGPETLIVISSDLSHYHHYETARKMDRITADAVQSFKPDQIGFEAACGRTGLNALLIVAKKRGLTIKLVDLRNSGDTAGTQEQVVGYGGWILSEQVC